MNIPEFLPLVLIASVVVWYAFFEWLRHRSYVKHIKTGFAPGTQGLLTVGILGAFLFVVGCMVLMILR